jgi:hypothetical protein
MSAQRELVELIRRHDETPDGIEQVRVGNACKQFICDHGPTIAELIGACEVCELKDERALFESSMRDAFRSLSDPFYRYPSNHAHAGCRGRYFYQLTDGAWQGWKKARALPAAALRKLTEPKV